MWYGRENHRMHFETDGDGNPSPNYRERRLVDLKDYYVGKNINRICRTE